MNNGMQYHPANELTSIMVHQPENLGDHISSEHIEEHLSGGYWYDQRMVYSYNMEL
jgi:hypothetical protein